MKAQAVSLPAISKPMATSQGQSAPNSVSDNPSAMSALIKTHARELGFQKVGIVRAEALVPERRRLEAWLQRGYHGEIELDGA